MVRVRRGAERVVRIGAIDSPLLRSSALTENGLGVTRWARSPEGASESSPGHKPWERGYAVQHLPYPGLTPWATL